MKDIVFEGELLFFSEHYRIALIEIPLDVQFHVEIPAFGSYPKYGDKVFTLAREHEELSVMVRRGTVSRLQECYEFRHHFLYVDYELPKCGGGGPVVDRNGDVVGMSFHHTDGCSAILSISTALLCIETWKKFGCIARPSLGMCFKNAECGGFIVEKVSTDSTAWKLGIRKGNEIVSFDGKCPTPLPGFEDFLLSCGLEHLRSMDTEVWELEVHDRGADVKRKITLHVSLSVVSKGWTD
ncbi:hypothetical protein EJB05_33297 [Eragrostis curvula]|uniref:PDZ domain-containing protein n=1 Tax=Eragrostis curvula TaxID=38414 RepID=A0A5J9U1G2_9POAL|nr:hypothetical protein EJB05_33297 [Eragrostis curvula]